MLYTWTYVNPENAKAGYIELDWNDYCKVYMRMAIQVQVTRM